ncbi:MAG TPA: phytoene/squalene synthase family protein [Jatrophihabitans sp.]|nr:phytoene/squalene synthase family protein [Jatrophihabitans sp.]
MTGRLARAELAAAGIEQAQLVEGYCRARRLNAEHGKTYYLAALLLPAAKRPYVHALYGFARYADDIVDRLDPASTADTRAAEFDRWCAGFRDDLAAGRSSDPLIAALIDTSTRWQLPHQLFGDFLRSMAMDLTVTEYRSFTELAEYMWGSAAVIGLQMLPILGYRAGERERAEHCAAQLGLAFQLTNFLRDVGEDLDRGRVYLPQESLQSCGVDLGQLQHARRTGRVDLPIRRLLALEIERARSLYRAAEPGIDLLEPPSRECMRTAFVLYGEILDRIEQTDYQIFAGRIAVALPRRVQVAAGGLARSRWSRMTSQVRGLARSDRRSAGTSPRRGGRSR